MIMMMMMMMLMMVTQGLNFIAGLLLLVIKDEEKTFCLLNTLLNNILPGNCLSNDS